MYKEKTKIQLELCNGYSVKANKIHKLSKTEVTIQKRNSMKKEAEKIVECMHKKMGKIKESNL